MKSKTWLNHFSLLLVGLLFSITVSAQQKTVEGKVLDNVSGTPLVGASVTVKGSENGVLTNA
ncbi:MAG: CarboxypepD reg-like domain, partial [Bacteroidota bacterium]